MGNLFVAEKPLTNAAWYQQLSALIDAIESEEFCSELAKVCQQLTGYDSTVIIAFIHQQKPRLLFSNLSEVDESPTLGPYFDGAYLLDPFYDLFKQDTEDGLFRLKEIAPDGFFETEYYRSYFKNTRIIDETGLMVRLDRDIELAISCGQREGSAPREFQIQDLRTVFPLLASACRRHWSGELQHSELTGKVNVGGEFGSTLEVAFLNFGKDHLTSRECEIVHLILKGYASKSIAELLGISVDTVKVHRKRFHSKLKVSSQAELFSLFLEAISMVPLGSEQDPLSFYYESQEIRPGPE